MRMNGYLGLSGWYFDAVVGLYSVNSLGALLEELLIPEPDWYASIFTAVILAWQNLGLRLSILSHIQP